MPSPKRRIKFVSNYCYRMDQIECLSKFSKLSNFLQIISNWGFSNKRYFIYSSLSSLLVYLKLLRKEESSRLFEWIEAPQLYLSLSIVDFPIETIQILYSESCFRTLKDYIQYIETYLPSPPTGLL